MGKGWQMKTVSPRNNRNVSSKIIVKKMGLGHACCLGIADCGANFWLLICAKVYCPKGHSVPMDKINKSIRAINTCPAPTAGRSSLIWRKWS